ncbi:hypothetical protein TSUD_59410 [Trifolium subterraneum]|uniref:Uncharacterized protein n=1 Tax=Trifolium subterraneum TaxID=3900 RepID=A0A2Z6MYX6_TRISU|nr:hypothetical protein TSUD_59410 [Trifolium subterraneum]
MSKILFRQLHILKTVSLCWSVSNFDDSLDLNNWSISSFCNYTLIFASGFPALFPLAIVMLALLFAFAHSLPSTNDS